MSRVSLITLGCFWLEEFKVLQPSLVTTVPGLPYHWHGGIYLYCTDYRDINCNKDNIFPGKQDKVPCCICYCTTEWFLDTLHHRRDVPACLLQSRYVSYGKCMTHHEKENQSTMTSHRLLSGCLVSDKIGQIYH